MRRLWIVLALLGSIGVARAWRADSGVVCCPHKTLLPERNAIGVPINTKVWVIGSDTESYELSGGIGLVGLREGPPSLASKMINLPRLAANHRYAIDGTTGTSTVFTTGAKADLEPPLAPHPNVFMSVLDGPTEAKAVTSFAMSGIGPDGALVRIRIDDGSHTVGFLRSGRELSTCNLGIEIIPGHVQVSVSTLDLAGNESPVVTVPVVVSVSTDRPTMSCPHAAGPPDRPTSEGMTVRCDGGATALFFVVVTILGGLVIAIVAIALMRRYRRPSEPSSSEPISLLVAEHAARSIRKRSGMFAGFGLAGLVAILAVGIPVFPWIFVIWTVPALRGYLIAQSALGVIEAAGATAEANTSTITVHAGPRIARLHLTRSELADAKRRGVPAASMRE
ncbi:MAG: hypothetical protein JWO36_7474 [Myxococcales bacterium]|nr:hypothetical protein [Myxococcales bacterium]